VGAITGIGISALVLVAVVGALVVYAIGRLKQEDSQASHYVETGGKSQQRYAALDAYCGGCQPMSFGYTFWRSPEVIALLEGTRLRVMPEQGHFRHRHRHRGTCEDHLRDRNNGMLHEGQQHTHAKRERERERDERGGGGGEVYKGRRRWPPRRGGGHMTRG
jgi:hypothetical protein